jgi:hypothetical protein
LVASSLLLAVNPKVAKTAIEVMVLVTVVAVAVGLMTTSTVLTTQHRRRQDQTGVLR